MSVLNKGVKRNKIFKGKFINGIFTIFLTGCINIPIGDGNKMKISKDGITFTDEEGGEHSISIDEEEGQFQMKGFGMDDEDEGLTLGQNLELPKDFPSDIPIPDDANIHQTNSVQSNVSVSFETETDIEEIIKLYETYLSDNFTEEPKVLDIEGEGSINKVYEVEGEDSGINIAIDGSTEGGYNTKVHITYQKNEEEGEE